MNSKNVLLTIVAVLLIIIIGGMGSWWYSYGYINSTKPYNDSYKDYSESELTKMHEKGDLDATAELGNKAFEKENTTRLMLYI